MRNFKWLASLIFKFFATCAVMYIFEHRVILFATIWVQYVSSTFFCCIAIFTAQGLQKQFQNNNLPHYSTSSARTTRRSWEELHSTWGGFWMNRTWGSLKYRLFNVELLKGGGRIPGYEELRRCVGTDLPPTDRVHCLIQMARWNIR